MAEIIDFQKKTQAPLDNLISDRPWEFRKADWETVYFLQMLRSQAEKLETHRAEVFESGGSGIRDLPVHHVLKGGAAYTIRAMYAAANDEEKMREVYYLAGLMDCLIRQVNPVLRTDLVRDMYRKIFKMKETLRVQWYGPLDQILLPIDGAFYNEREYRASLKRAGSLKALYGAIREGSEEMFAILAHEYVFYCPRGAISL